MVINLYINIRGKPKVCPELAVMNCKVTKYTLFYHHEVKKEQQTIDKGAKI